MNEKNENAETWWQLTNCLYSRDCEKTVGGVQYKNRSLF